MFIEQDNDAKFLKEHFLCVSFPTLLDIAYTDEELLGALKSPNEKAYLHPSFPRPTNPKIQILNDEMFAALESESFDCVATRNSLHLAPDVKTVCTTSAKLVKRGGTFIICDTVTDCEDAYLNSFQFRQNSAHVRFYTVAEIVSAASEAGFALEFFKRIQMPVSLKQSPEYSTFLDEVPECVRERLAIVKDSSDQPAGFSLQKGIFIFKKI